MGGNITFLYSGRERGQLATLSFPGILFMKDEDLVKTRRSYLALMNA